MIKVYGTAACGSTKKRLAFYNERGIEVEFIDLKTEPPSREFIRRLIIECGEKKVLNKCSASWRSLSDEVKSRASTSSGLVELLAAKPLLIKRPVVESNGRVCIGSCDEFVQE